MLCKGFIREDEHPKMGLNVGRQKRQMTPPMGYHMTCVHQVTLQQNPFPLSLPWPYPFNALSPSLTFNSSQNYKETLGKRLYRLTARSSFTLPVPHTPFSVGQSTVLKDASQYLRNKHALLWASLVLSRRFSASWTDCCSGRRVGWGGVAAGRSERHLHCVFPPHMTICFQS